MDAKPYIPLLALLLPGCSGWEVRVRPYEREPIVLSGETRTCPAVDRAQFDPTLLPPAGQPTILSPAPGPLEVQPGAGPAPAATSGEWRAVPSARVPRVKGA